MIVIILLAVIVLYVLVNVLRVFYKINISHKLVAKSQPYTQEVKNPKASVLFIGDSTGVGTGAESNKDSVAGRFGSEHPDINIDNLSKNGAKIEDLFPKLKELPSGKYKLIIIQIGGNNVIQFKDLNKAQKDLEEVVKTAKNKSENVVLITTGNVGLAPFFPWPVNAILSVRSYKLREAAIKITKDNGAYYVDLYKNKDEDPFAADPNKYHAIDGLHPSSDGYGIWYQRLKETLDANSVKI